MIEVFTHNLKLEFQMNWWLAKLKDLCLNKCNCEEFDRKKILIFFFKSWQKPCRNTGQTFSYLAIKDIFMD